MKIKRSICKGIPPQEWDDYGNDLIDSGLSIYWGKKKIFKNYVQYRKYLIKYLPWAKEKKDKNLATGTCDEYGVDGPDYKDEIIKTTKKHFVKQFYNITKSYLRTSTKYKQWDRQYNSMRNRRFKHKFQKQNKIRYKSIV